MRKLAMCIGLLVVLCLFLSGCQWATWNEAWRGPATRAGCTPQPGTSYAIGRMEFVPVGEGRWRDDDGRTRTETVYIMRERAPHGPHGEKGPAGPAGPTSRPACLIRPVDLERLDGEALAMSPPARRVTVTPAGQASAFDANSGSYHRDITVVSPPWGSDPAKTVSGVEPFKAKVGRTPPYTSRDFTIGEGGIGSFTGGDMTDWKDTVRRGPILLMILGGLMLAAGIVVAVWAGRVVLGLAVGGAGLALIATGVLFEMYPWVVLIAAAGVLGVGLWWLIDSRGLLRAREAVAAQAGALSAVVRGVEAAPDEAQAAVKESIASAATASGDAVEVKRTITDAKAAAGVG